MRTRLVRSSPLGTRRAAFLTAVLAVCTAAGCGSSGSSASGELSPNGRFDTGTRAPAGGPTAVSTDRLFKTVLARYRAYQAAYQQAYEKNDPAGLTDVAMDPLLTEVTDDVEATKAKGQIWRFTKTLNPRVYANSKDRTKVYLIDCVNTVAGYRFSAKTGKRTGGGKGGAYLYRYTVQYDGGSWKVAASVRDRTC
ncbi:hypothetical protein [Actinomadura mexicana]|uniref:Mce-associated membrane protein n=1 Tax=Actinomadura mexicana TaxID=134959 RepID=A0A238WZF7_9ACTN|nr:hypothetical protein [Actinomadura mexicana]SNR51967.1 hypothetical protein SAMN06265355_103505 [Actinomadura mexicana]